MPSCPVAHSRHVGRPRDLAAIHMIAAAVPSATNSSRTDRHSNITDNTTTVPVVRESRLGWLVDGGAPRNVVPTCRYKQISCSAFIFSLMPCAVTAVLPFGLVEVLAPIEPQRTPEVLQPK